MRQKCVTLHSGTLVKALHLVRISNLCHDLDPCLLCKSTRKIHQIQQVWVDWQVQDAGFVINRGYLLVHLNCSFLHVSATPRNKRCRVKLQHVLVTHTTKRFAVMLERDFCMMIIAIHRASIQFFATDQCLACKTTCYATHPLVSLRSATSLEIWRWARYFLGHPKGNISGIPKEFSRESQ